MNMQKYKFTANEVIVKEPLAAKATQIIRNKIISGECPQGSRITEDDFAQAMQISRACIREAFIILQNEGLINRYHNKYTEVVKFKKQDVVEIYRLRAALEKMAVEECIRSGNIPYHELMHKAEICRDVYNGSVEEFIHWIDADLDFHWVFMRSAGNSRALKVWESLRSQVYVFIFSIKKNNPEDFVIGGIRNHFEIMDAVKSLDLQGALEMIERHIIAGLEQLIFNLYQE